MLAGRKLTDPNRRPGDDSGQQHDGFAVAASDAPKIALPNLTLGPAGIRPIKARWAIGF